MTLPNLQLGTTVLNIELLVYLVAGMIGVYAVRYRQRRHPDRERQIGDAWNAVFLWLLVWKGSLFLFDPAGVIAQPLSLLFFSGGTRGIWIASLAALAYLFMRNYRRVGSGEAIKLAASWGGVMLVAAMIGYTALIPIEGKGGVRIDQAAPEFELTDLDGNAVKLSDFRGRTVVLNFWATWCRVCRAEMPQVEKFYQEHKDQEVVVLSVNATTQESNPGLVRDYADKRELSFPIVLDDRGEALGDYGVTAYPTTYVIDPAGLVKGRYLGAFSYENMKKAVRNAS
ncbi:TlpA family protein disulfide reductase [Cohnella cellulosilytica]|uniref:TlpA family protein disulfide reductase n=1 Tax=Cohnella cellulosilytica TaxID=986710 RepID=A0ABW2FCN6_9BACL